VIWKALERYRDHGLLVLRVGFGLGFIWYHGWGKITGGPERWAALGGSMEYLGITFAPVFWGLMASMAETVGALCIVLGLFFRPAALVLAFVMVMATVNHHVTGQGTPAHSFKNIWLFVGLMAIGPGRFSLDHIRERRRAAKHGADSTAPSADPEVGARP